VDVDYWALFAEMGKRPGLYGLDGSYGQICAFLAGADAVTDGLPLTGFREFLVVRAGLGNNLTWQGLVLRLAFPAVATGWPALLQTVDGNRTAVRTLFALLDEFLVTRAGVDGPARIVEEYQAWLEQQSWHRS
jgi:hypothetical protein